MINKSIFFILIIAFSTSGCSKKSKSETKKITPIIYKADQKRIRKRVEFLTTKEMKGREAYTKESKITADYIVKGFKKAGLTPLNNKYIHKFKAKTNKWDQNVIGVIKGSSTDKIIIIGAHYDHLGIRNGKLYPGADDNATGVAVLMELALILGNHKLKHTIWFVGFGAEEKGMHGSLSLVSSKMLVKNKIKLMINLDMLGRNLYELSFGDTMPQSIGMIIHKIDKKLTTFVIKEAKKVKIDVMVLKDSFLRQYGGNFFYDSIPFNKKGISTIFFSTSLHKDYHKPTDTIEKLNFPKLTKTTKILKNLLIKTAN
jgi:Zn-dependent M28 family amino/carboxypeptidase